MVSRLTSSKRAGSERSGRDDGGARGEIDYVRLPLANNSATSWRLRESATVGRLIELLAKALVASDHARVAAQQP
jgi:hypothetical protein